MTFDKLAWQRAQRRANGNADTKRYERSPKGKLMRIYRNMQSRVEGVQRHKHHLYAGKTLLSREEFYAWAENHPDYLRLHAAWEESGYQRGLCPTVDRIDAALGYELSNMRWLTHAENSQLGALSRHRSQSEHD